MTSRALLAALACLAAAAPAAAKDIVVQMKNFAGGKPMAFEPAYVEASVGDKVHFMPTDAGHNAAPIDGMLPAGVTLPAGAINKEYVVAITKPGLYGIKCTPHYSFGMVALIKAGKGAAPNAATATAAAASIPPLAGKRMTVLLAGAK